MYIKGLFFSTRLNQFHFQRMGHECLEGKKVSSLVQQQIHLLVETLGIRIKCVRLCCNGRALFVQLQVPLSQRESMEDGITTDERRLAIFMVSLGHVLAATNRCKGPLDGCSPPKGSKYTLSVENTNCGNEESKMNHMCPCKIGPSGEMHIEEGGQVEAAEAIMDAWTSRKINIFTIQYGNCSCPLGFGRTDIMAQTILDEQRVGRDSLRERQLAAAMSLQKRLGIDSPMHGMSDDNFFMACKDMQEDRLWKPSRILQHVREERQKLGVRTVIARPFF